MSFQTSLVNSLESITDTRFLAIHEVIQNINGNIRQSSPRFLFYSIGFYLLVSSPSDFAPNKPISKIGSKKRKSNQSSSQWPIISSLFTNFFILLKLFLSNVINYTFLTKIFNLKLSCFSLIL